MFNHIQYFSSLSIKQSCLKCVQFRIEEYSVYFCLNIISLFSFVFTEVKLHTVGLFPYVFIYVDFYYQYLLAQELFRNSIEFLG